MIFKKPFFMAENRDIPSSLRNLSGEKIKQFFMRFLLFAKGSLLACH